MKKGPIFGVVQGVGGRVDGFGLGGHVEDGHDVIVGARGREVRGRFIHKGMERRGIS